MKTEVYLGLVTYLLTFKRFLSKNCDLYEPLLSSIDTVLENVVHQFMISGGGFNEEE